MSSKDVAVSVRGLGKAYTIQHNAVRATTAGEALMQRITNPMQRPDTETFWALKDLSFDINRGDIVGIIGRNGAGKSTLLKVLSRITEPTTGRVDIYGRVGSLLEVGTGFHPELTGRENIFLNGAILGMSRREIARKFDDIVAFSGVEKFLDTPVKRYSSGMYVRLAFAVAAHLNSDILVVDEVLAVGDANFQKKCLGKMDEVAKSGRTVLFVTHNMQIVSTLTRTGIMMSGGRCIFQGSAQEAITLYVKEGGNNDIVYRGEPHPSEPRVTRVELCTSLPANVHHHGSPFEAIFEITTPVPVEGAWFSFQVVNSYQQSIQHCWTLDAQIPMCREPGVYRLRCRIPKDRLYMGDYTITANLSEPPGGRFFEKLEGICPFEVVMYGQYREFEWQPNTCTYLEEYEWRVERAEEDVPGGVLAGEVGAHS